MAAGQGFKTFVTGEVLTSGDVNGYLMQGINVFTNATARDAAITAPAEGQFAFTKDNNSLWYYDGAAWVASGATGDIEGVTAGVGISGGGTSGTVTVTNSMATAIDAKGDLVPGTGADTFSRLAVGANNTVLTADSAEATGMKWATPASGATLVGCSVWKNADVGINNATYTTVDYNQENYDTDGFHSNSVNPSRITIPTGKGGKYQIFCVIIFDNSTVGGRQILLNKNGGTILQNYGSAPTGRNTQTLYTVETLSAGDYLEVQIYQNCGGALTAFFNGTNNYFGVNYIGA